MALGVAVIVPAVAAAYTLINLLVVIAIIGQTTGMFLPSQYAARDCDRERTSIPVTVAGDLEAHLLVGRPDGRFDYEIHPVDLTGTGAHDVTVRLVGAAHGTAAPGEPFTITLPLVGSSDLGPINTVADVSLVLTPNPDERTADARVLRVRTVDPCERRSDLSAAPTTTGGTSASTEGFGVGALRGTAACASAALLGLLTLRSRKRRR